jgi:hypothetical protein
MVDSPIAECVKLLLGAAAEPWSDMELLPLFELSLTRNAPGAAVLVELLQVEGVHFPTSKLRHALAVTLQIPGMRQASCALLNALPHRNQAVLELAGK